jgi:hypothetical protein
MVEQLPADDSDFLEGPKYTVGTFEAFLLLLEELGEEMEFSALEVMDSEPDVRGYYDSLFAQDYSSEAKEEIAEQFGIDFYIRRLLVLHPVEITPSCRGKNLGLALATELIREYGRGCDLIATIPYPLQSTRNAKAPVDLEEHENEAKRIEDGKKKLTEYWKELGFQKVGDSGVLAMNYVQFCLNKFENDQLN